MIAHVFCMQLINANSKFKLASHRKKKMKPEKCQITVFAVVCLIFLALSPALHAQEEPVAVLAEFSGAVPDVWSAAVTSRRRCRWSWLNAPPCHAAGRLVSRERAVRIPAPWGHWSKQQRQFSAQNRPVGSLGVQLWVPVGSPCAGARVYARPR